MKTLILIGLQILLFFILARPLLAQYDGKEVQETETKEERKEREKKEARKLAKKLESEEAKRIQTNRRLYKARADAFSDIGNETGALQYYDSALVYILLDEKEDIEEAKAKKKEWRYPKDYLDIIRRLGFIHANNASYQLADSLLSWHTEIIKRQEGEKDSEYADALADLAELYRQQGNFRKADSILTVAEPIVRRARWRVGITNFLKDYLNAVLAETLTKDGYNFYLSAVPNAKKIISMVTQITTKYPANSYTKSLEFRQDTRARYIYNLQEINQVKIDLNDFKNAETKIMLALKETEKRFPEREVYEKQSEKTAIDKETEKRLRREYEENQDRFMRERALVLSSAADLYIRQGNFARADSLLQESMYTVQGNLRVLHEDDATVLSGYESYLQREEYGKAKEWLEYALKVYRENLGTDHVAYLRAVIKLGQLYQLEEKEIEAEHVYKEISNALSSSETELKTKIDALAALEAKKQGWMIKFAKKASQVLKLLGKIPDWIHDFIDADEIAKQKLGGEIVHLSAKTALRITLLSQMADLYIARADYKRAEKNLNEVIKYYEANSLDKSIPCVQALAQLIKVYEGLGDKKADETRIRKREILKAILGESNVNYSFDVLRETPIGSEGDKKILLSALENIKNQKGVNSLSYADGLYLLGEALANANSMDEASQYYENYLATVKSFAGQNSRAYAEALYRFGLHQKRRKQYSQALASFHQSKQIYLAKFNAYYPNVIDIIGSTADLYVEWNKLDSAEANYKVEVERILHRVGNVFPSLDEASREKFISKMNTRLGVYQDFILKQLQKNPNKKYLTALLYDEVLATKALLFNTNNKIRYAILSSNDTSAIDKYKRVREKKDFLMKAQLKTTDEQKAEGIDINKLESEIKDIETELTAKFPIYAESLQEKKYSWKQVKEKLKGNMAAVEIVRIGTDKNPTYVALIVKPTTKDYPELVIFPNGLGMESNLLKAAKNQIQKGSDVKTNPYNDFWQPLGSKLISPTAGVKPKVYLSLDGVYNQLSINALKDAKSKKYVIDDFDLWFIASTRDLIEENAYTQSRKDNFAAWTVAMFGFPKYDYAPPSIKKKPKERRFALAYGDLEGTKEEVEQIEKIVSQKSARCLKLMNEQATEDTVKRLQVNPHILHIATHGFFIQSIDEDEENSGTNVLPEKILKENALSLTGLLLAGAKYDFGYVDNREDGIFTAYEAMNLNLNNTELVVLSACETGLGEVKNGEGVYGMQRAFQSAGAKTVLMSLWKVYDQATKLLMTTFYENWFKSGNCRNAFQKAQLALKNSKDFNSPQFWGAFVMVGQ